MLKVDKGFWNLGDFPPVVQNGSEAVILTNPWTNGTKAAPFDQCRLWAPHSHPIAYCSFVAFYLILNVAVGGTNGWFPDNHGDKVWLDESKSAYSSHIRSPDFFR